jgi:hypothetical protein
LFLKLKEQLKPLARFVSLRFVLCRFVSFRFVCFVVSQDALAQRLEADTTGDSGDPRISFSGRL